MADELLFDATASEEPDDQNETVLRYFRTQGNLQPVQELWVRAAEAQWHQYAELERRLYGGQRWDLPSYPTFGGPAFEQGERLADQERRRLNLGTAPIRSMIGLLEGEGVKVLLRPSGAEETVSGAYFFSEGLGPCVLVNEDDPPSRRRFTEAHEYCHFLVDRRSVEGEICALSRRRETFEMRANAFAAAFLMPANGIRDALEEANLRPGEVGPEDIVHLMYRFGVSYQAILWRLLNLRLIARPDRETLAAHTPSDIAERLGYRYEPGQTEATPDRFRRLALEAWRAEQITASELEELLGEAEGDVAALFGEAGRPTRRAAPRPPAEPDWL